MAKNVEARLDQGLHRGWAGKILDVCDQCNAALCHGKLLLVCWGNDRGHAYAGDFARSFRRWAAISDSGVERRVLSSMCTITVSTLATQRPF
jgi:hypothetical protein